MSVEKHHAFIDSLEGEKGLPEDHTMMIRRIRAAMLLIDASDNIPSPDKGELRCVLRDAIHRLDRAESRQIPDLKEKVKELVRDAMDAQAAPIFGDSEKTLELCAIRDEFRALCAPDKGGEVKP